jgi:putative FmdB family regulatory protein
MKIMYDWECTECHLIFEWLAKSNAKSVKCPLCFDAKAKKVFITPLQFKLKYNPKTDLVDWDGNTSQYWNEYKKMKAEGQNPRIPSLDGDGPNLSEENRIND